MAFEPLKDRLLVIPEEQSNTPASGLYIPDTAKEKPLQGKVTAAGPIAIEDGINGNIATRSLFYEGISKLDLLSTPRHRRTDNGCKNDSSEYIVKFHCIYLYYIY